MAMTKKEKGYVEFLENEIAEAIAFRFTEDIAPDVFPPTGYDEIAIGYDFNSYNSTVSPAWTSSNSHGSGHVRDRSASREAIDLYSTKKLALRALRRTLEKKYSAELARIDRMIKDAQ
jgi:hypothetical protein